MSERRAGPEGRYFPGNGLCVKLEGESDIVSVRDPGEVPDDAWVGPETGGTMCDLRASIPPCLP